MQNLANHCERTPEMARDDGHQENAASKTELGILEIASWKPGRNFAFLNVRASNGGQKHASKMHGPWKIQRESD